MLLRLNFPVAVPKLFGKSVYLRKLCERDIPAWFIRATDTESADLAGDPIPASIEAGAAWLQRHADRFRQRTAIRWAIVANGTDESVGTVGLSITCHEARIAELGIVVGRSHWNEGFGTAAVQLVSRYAFHMLGLAEIQAEILQRNQASIRLLEKCGFRRVCITAGGTQTASPSEVCLLYALLNRHPSTG